MFQSGTGNSVQWFNVGVVEQPRVTWLLCQFGIPVFKFLPLKI